MLLRHKLLHSDALYVVSVREAAGLFEGEGVTKVLTVEASGIAFAVAVAAAMGVPAVFAKKHENSKT